MGRLRSLHRKAALAAVAYLLAGPALAQPDICTRLEARLVALDSRAGVGASDKSQAIEKSIRDQQQALDRATAEARRAGCMGLFQRFRANSGCNAMTASINRMRAKLNRLNAALDRADDQRFGGSDERRELIRALAANQCGPHYEDYAGPARRGTLFGSLFGRRLFRDRNWGDPFGDGTFRTLCVRTCDGYYFPISFTTVRSRFARDAQLCQSMCPGTEVALYVHRNPGEESEAMVSLAGEPYTALPTAFRYRREYDRGCKCGKIAAAPVAASEAVAGYLAAARADPWSFARGADATRPPSGDLPVPLARPNASEDPETLANRSGDLVPATMAPPPSAAVAGLSSGGERHVRVVGPTYFYSQ